MNNDDALQLKYRPRTLDELYGNEPAKTAIGKEFAKSAPSKVYLITGPSGCGKTTIAYILRDMLGCHSSAFHEYDASTDRGIDKLRRIKGESQLLPMAGKVVVLFFDECHQITGPAQESMLKMLETPPPHVYCILATTEPTKLKITLQRRCTKIPVDFLTRGDTVKLLKDIAELEGKNWMSSKLFSAIYKSSFGSPGLAAQLLDQVINLSSVSATKEQKEQGEEEAKEFIESVTHNQGFVIDLCRTLASQKLTGREKWIQSRDLLKTFKGNAESARLAILGYLNTMLLNMGHPAIANTMATFNESMMFSGKSGLTLATFYACQDFIDAEEERKDRKNKK
jgi:DNA polymerase III gamma/tau subunit